MTRAQQTISLGLLAASVYMVCFMGLMPLPSKIQDEIVPYIPLWALVTFGAYLLFKLGFGVLTFNDVPEAYQELMGQIDEAKADLRKRGVQVD